MPDEVIPNDQLVKGQLYQVRLEDCCIQGGFTAVFLGWVDKGDIEQIIEYNPDEYPVSKWDNGIILGPHWGAWRCKVA